MPPRNSRRDINDTLGLKDGDTTLGTPLPVQFSDYFATVTVTKDDAGNDITPFEHPIYEGTHPGFVDPAYGPSAPSFQRRKYPFTSDQYSNAFFAPFVEGVDLTPLKFRLIVEACDTRGTGDPTDDIISRKAFIAQIKIPDILIDQVQLAPGQAGVDYTEVMAASGGVPPLGYELEYVDGNGDGIADPGDALSKEIFGIDLDVNTGFFFGVPRASSTAAGGVDLTVRVYAAVMNPVQAGVRRRAVPRRGIRPSQDVHGVLRSAVDAVRGDAVAAGGRGRPGLQRHGERRGRRAAAGSLSGRLCRDLSVPGAGLRMGFELHPGREPPGPDPRARG
ncbi:MAG: hypothetical protein ACYS0K_12375 [Planctomycetota bacterium]